MKLYFFKGSCALAAHVTLEWVGADYEPVEVQRSATRSPEFLAELSPYGKVPVLELDDGRKLTQVNAIQLWLARHYPEAGLGPEVGPGANEERLYEMQNLLSYFNGDVHPAFTPYFMTFRFTGDKEARGSVKEAALEEIGFHLSILDGRMAGRDWVMGDRRSVLDPYLYVFCTWARFLPGGLDGRAGLGAFAEWMDGDEGVKKALEMQGLG